MAIKYLDYTMYSILTFFYFKSSFEAVEHHTAFNVGLHMFTYKNQINNSLYLVGVIQI